MTPIVFHGNMNRTFWPMVKHLESGDIVKARGRSTFEQLHVVSVLPDPRQRVFSKFGRRANPFFQAAETVWILNGSSHSEWLLYFNSQMGKFLDANSPHFHAPYGERMLRWGQNSRLDEDQPPVNQIRSVINELSADPASRRAVMIFGHPAWDLPAIETNDRPCNIAFTFKIRGGRLHMTTFNRSNDLILGLSFTNVCQFTTIQEVISTALGVGLGEYTHWSDSLHMYQDDPVFSHMEQGDRFDLYNYAKPVGMKDPWGYEALFWRNEDRAASPESFDAQLPVCPYWHSVGLMLLAYDALKKDNPIEAINYVSRMEARDWQVMCFEYINRWLSNRQLRHIRNQLRIVIDEYNIRLVDFVMGEHET